tara:strand:- start:1098 stop:1223 length:126 start_codon:yes stop_codon:yes gene_type:complete
VLFIIVKDLRHSKSADVAFLKEEEDFKLDVNDDGFHANPDR